MNLPDLIGIADIAKRLGLEGTAVRRLIRREGDALGIELHRGKGLKLLLTREDADKLVASYEAGRSPLAVSGETSDEARYDGFGFFYLIQLVPEALPDRVKIGFADNAEKRLAEHRSAAPTARLLKSWPCKRSWDYAAMDSITRTGCKLVLNEVYEGEVEGFIQRGDAFFAMMPVPETTKQLSEHSPLFDLENSDSQSDEDIA